MRLLQLIPVLAATSAIAAGQTLCQKYTSALFGNDTPANQYTLLVKLVNTVVIGNYTPSSLNIAVPGILADAMYNGHSVSLLQYFNGSLIEVNNGNGHPGVQNFLDDGGAAPLKLNMPSYTNSSAQYFLLTHLYQFFGVLLGCDEGSSAFPSYGGTPSMFEVHKYMSLSHPEVGYFNSQVELAALSFGVSKSDATAVFNTLQSTFNYKCNPAETIIPANGSKLQSICAAHNCPVDPSNPYSNCKAYPNGGVFPAPMPAE